MFHLYRSRLSVRLTVLFLLASLAPAIAIGALTLAQLERSVRADAERRMELLAGVVEDLLHDSIDSAEEKLTTVSRLLATELEARQVGAFSGSNLSYRETVLERLEGVVEPAGVFLELQYFAAAETPGDEPTFVGLAQQVSVIAQQNAAVPDPAEQNRINVLSNMAEPVVRDPVAGAPHRDAELQMHAGFPTLRLSRPIAEHTGTTGALVAYVDFGALAATCARLAGDSVSIRVSDGGGTALVAAGMVDDARVERIGRVRRVALDPSGASAAGSEPWRVEVAESEASLRAPVARLRARMLPWFAVAALAAVALSLAFSARITWPIAKLRRAAEAMEAGDLGARAKIAREDEIGSLGAAFDRMAAALHQLDAARSEFLGNVSHELRTPLTSLRLSVGNVLDGVTGEVSAAQRAALERVRRELARLSTLVDDLLELARLEAGGSVPNLEGVELGDLARECVEALRPRADERGVVLRAEGSGHARADSAMMRRVLWNLIDNGVKFTQSGGAVRVLVADGRIRVEDDGPGGVPADAFVRFRQGARDAGEGAKPEGVGLGLAIVARLVELHGGRIDVEDRAGDGVHGAAFTVHLDGGGAA